MVTNILATLCFGVKECRMRVDIISIVKCFKVKNHHLYKMWVSYMFIVKVGCLNYCVYVYMVMLIIISYELIVSSNFVV